MNDMEFVDRNILGICKDHLNYITMADCKHFRGDAIDLETFSGNIISGIVFTKRRKLLIFKFTECEKTEETLMTSWYPAVTAVFNDKTITKVWSFFDQIDLGVGQILDFRQNLQEFPFSIIDPNITITITITYTITIIITITK